MLLLFILFLNFYNKYNVFPFYYFYTKLKTFYLSLSQFLLLFSLFLTYLSFTKHFKQPKSELYSITYLLSKIEKSKKLGNNF